MKRGSRLTALAGALALIATMTSVSAAPGAADPGDPQFIVEVYNDFVNVYRWSGPATITVTIDDPTTGLSPDYTKTETGPADTGFLINFWDDYDVKPGHLVEVTDGTTTLTHTVMNVAITELNPGTDVVTGIADPGSEIQVAVGGPEENVPPLLTSVTADAMGNWVANLGAKSYDLLDGAWTSAFRTDPNGNATSFILNPTFTVHVYEGNLHTWGWLPGIQITLTIDDPATAPSPDFTTTATSPPSGQGFEIDPGAAFHVQRGHIVTMTDGTSNVVHVVRDVYVTSASIATGEVRGTADPGAALQVEAPTPAGRVLEPVVADSSGNWVAGPFDLLPGSWGHVWQHDTVNNSTDVLWFPTLVFGGHYYEVIDEPATWHNAAAYCEQDGGYLATINSAEENQFVYNLTDIGNQTWLGATDEAVEGTWKWVTGEPFDYTNWGLGEPNNNAPGPDPDLGEDYLTFHGEGAYDPPQPGVWNDWQYETDGSESTLPFVCESEERQVDVDIKPGSDTNPINLKSKGVIPVAIVTTDDFDATTVDPLSVRFGPAEATEAHERGHLEDVDGDGDIDLMLHFRTQETGIQPGDTEACLIGETFNGDALRGCDSIMVKGGKRR